MEEKDLPRKNAVLDDIRVIDLTRFFMGPYCTMLLADMGAEVIKVEQPAIGEETRHLGKGFIKGESAWFLGFNRNKKSITLDLHKDEGKQIIYRLVKESDVIVRILCLEL